VTGNGAYVSSPFATTAKFHGSADDAVGLFARGRDNALWTRKFIGGQWSGWSSLGGILSSAASVAPLPDGGFDVVVRGADNAIWTQIYDGTKWSGWASLGGLATSAPTITSNGVVAVRGGDGAVWITSAIGGGWSSLGGYILGDPSAAAFGASGVAFSAVGGDHAIWVRDVSFEYGWASSWESLGGFSTTSPSLAPADPTHPGAAETGYRLSTRGRDGARWTTTLQYFSDPGKSPVERPLAGWVSQGGYITSAPALAPMGGGRTFTFAVGGDGAVWENNGAGWGTLGGYLTSTPAVSPII
jgi:hypothetical protein